jgi:hypothetical protein
MPEASHMDAAQEAKWYLEGLTDVDGDTVWRMELKPLPVLIGRPEDCHLRLAAREVSRHHAGINARDGGLWIREFSSTNGTFVNGRRVSGTRALKDERHPSLRSVRVSCGSGCSNGR